jgi:hypothetical protein
MGVLSQLQTKVTGALSSKDIRAADSCTFNALDVVIDGGDVFFDAEDVRGLSIQRLGWLPAHVRDGNRGPLRRLVRACEQVA